MDKKFYKTLMTLAVPIVIQEFTNSAVNLLDVFMIGTLGVHEITAVGLASQVFFLFIVMTFGISSGASILMGQFWGAEEVHNIKKTMGINIAAGIVIALVFSSIALFAPETVMKIYSKDPKVIEIGIVYLKSVGISYIFVAITLAISTALRSIGMTNIPMTTTLLALSLNAVFNSIFIFVLDMGVRGAALGTVMARAIELLAILSIVYFKKLPVAAKWRELFSANAAFLKAFVLVSLPVMIHEVLWAAGTSTYNIAYKYCGTEAQGAVQIANTVQMLFMVICFGICSASGIMTANALGAGEIDRAIANSRRFMKLSIYVSIPTGLLLALTAPLIVQIFNVSDDVKSLAIKIMIVIGATLVPKMFTFTTLAGILRSGGDTVWCMFVDIFFVWFIGVPLAFLGAVVLGLPIYWVVAMISLEEILKVFITGHRVLKNGWANKIV